MALQHIVIHPASVMLNWPYSGSTITWSCGSVEALLCTKVIGPECANSTQLRIGVSNSCL